MFRSAIGTVLVPGILVVASGCGPLGARAHEEKPSAVRGVQVDRPDLPLERLTERELERFKQGDALFEATIRASDGLGPLYVRDSCAACHAADGRGPGVVTKASSIANDASVSAKLLPFGSTERPYTTAGATMPLLAPRDPALRVLPRLPPAVFGRGYLEAITERDLEALARAAQQRSGSARGRLNRLQEGSIGRFGVKARLATLQDFSADALNGDMGITSPGRPEEPPGPEGLRDDDKPGVDFTQAQVELLRDYLRGLAIPGRKEPAGRGAALFRRAQCDVCHVPAFTTSAAYPVLALAAVRAEVYTDLLLHDMGEGLSDGIREESAGPREFRTAPLIGLRFLPSFLHDGRAKTVEDAIELHGAEDSEARDSVRQLREMSAAERAELVQFVEAL